MPWGYKFCLRYLSLADQQSPGDLSRQEAIDILNSGLALMPVQHVREQGWFANQVVGEQCGQNASANAQEPRVPTGVTVWCDLEGVYRHGRSPRNDSIAVMTGEKRLVMESILETKASTIQQFVQKQHHSVRSANTGSIRLARHAGIAEAQPPTASKIIAAATAVIGL